jgi:predicted Rossmann fold nucleotide-binding protein DprA/Smf involved in DNA uptake
MDENKQAILLLSSYFGKSISEDYRPLTPTEYGRIAAWLHEHDYQPSDLFHRLDEVEEDWEDPKGKITIERLKYLLGRGLAMGLALDKWHSAGIWTVTRSEIEYPQRLKQHLGQQAPAVLFGVGNKQLLNAGGLSVVGSRSIDDADRQDTETVGKQAALEGFNLVSGGARGVDETAMLGAISVEGTALGILANDLLKAAVAGKWRNHLKSGQLALISSYYPEAGFSAGNAMGRNKYIYCLSDYALVIRSDEGTGGTWSGSNEVLRKGWVPLFVKSPSLAEGNIALEKLGANQITIPASESRDEEWLRAKLNSPTVQHVAERPPKKSYQQGSLY